MQLELMKNRIENLICVLLALLVAGVVAYILYGKRVDEWRQVACSTLKNECALSQCQPVA